MPGPTCADLLRIKPNAKRMREGLTAGLFATDLVDDLVRKGLSFREAHGLVGAVFDPFGSVCRKKTAGSTHPDELKAQIAAAKRLCGTNGPIS